MRPLKTAPTQQFQITISSACWGTFWGLNDREMRPRRVKGPKIILRDAFFVDQ
jgi:hypothetical protein